jgi:hypothetical protein
MAGIIQLTYFGDENLTLTDMSKNCAQRHFLMEVRVSFH